MNYKMGNYPVKLIRASEEAGRIMVAFEFCGADSAKVDKLVALVEKRK